jgi:hypothetical protein
VTDSVEDIRNLGLANGTPAVWSSSSRQPQANIIETVDRVRAMLPRCRPTIPPATQLDVAMDRSTTIRASLRDVERSLAVAIVLVVLVVYLFLRDGRATLIPAVAVPVSLIGTFGAMYLLGLQPGQPLPDGPHDRHRLRRRRRHRRDGEHHRHMEAGCRGSRPRSSASGRWASPSSR